MSNVGTLGLSNIGGTATFSGAVSATTLNVAGTVVNFSSAGTGGVIGTAIFANSGNLTLGQAGGTQTYTGGVDTTVVGGTVTLSGTVLSVNTPQVYGAVSFANNTTLNSGTGAITLGNSTIANGVTLTVGAGSASTISMGTVSGVARGSASDLVINTTLNASVGVIGTDMGSVSGTANTLTLSDITTSGGMTFTVDTLVSPGTLTSTGGGDITLRPVTPARAMGVGAGVASGGLDLGTILANVFTSGRVTLGSATSGAITIGTQNLSANAYSGFSLLSDNANVTFNPGATLNLPSATDIRVSIGNGNVVGSSTVNNLVATAGTVRFAAGSVTIGTQVANLEASTTTSNGFVLVNSQGLNVLGAQRAGSSFLSAVNTKDYLVQTTAGDLNLSSGTTFTAQDVTLAAAGNFYNQAGSAPFTNQNGGRTLVFSSQPVDNQPPTATGGFSGFGTVYLATPNITIGTLGGYTVNNSLPSGNLMVFSGPPAFPLIEPGTSTYNDLVNTAVYQATVPILGYSLPGIYTGQVRLGFKSASAPVQNSIGGPSPVKPSPVADQPERMRVGKTPGNPVNDPMAENKLSPHTAGRLRVSQLMKPQPQVGSSESSVTKPAVRVGNVSLRMSGEFCPFELAEVTIGSAKVSQSR